MLKIKEMVIETDILPDNIGDIKFYTDHYIKDSTFAAFHGDNFEEFLFKFNDEIEMIKGIDFYLGKVIKEVEENTKKSKSR